MRPQLLGVLLSIASVVALGSLLSFRAHQEQSQQEIESLKAAIAALKAETRKTAAEVKSAEVDRLQLSDSITSLARAVQNEARQTPQPQPQPGEDLEEQPLQAKRPPSLSYEQSRVAVLSAYAAETADTAWSQGATRQLHTILGSHLLSGSRVHSIDCRATMCQVEVSHTAPEAHEAFLMDGFRGWGGAVFVAGDKQQYGERVVTLLVSREGMELPLGPR
jgi:hypothetical protein